VTVTSIGCTRELGDLLDRHQVGIPQQATRQEDLYRATRGFYQSRLPQGSLFIKKGYLQT
jgi:hypothetical protein